MDAEASCDPPRSQIDDRFLRGDDKIASRHRLKAERPETQRVSSRWQSVDTKRSIGFRQCAAGEARVTLSANSDRPARHGSTARRIGQTPVNLTNSGGEGRGACRRSLSLGVNG